VRNKTENRLAKKPSKRNLEYSEWELISDSEKHRLNSNDGEIAHLDYLKLDVTHLSVDESVAKIKEHFNF